jgi:hypothetical protein
MVVNGWKLYYFCPFAAALDELEAQVNARAPEPGRLQVAPEDAAACFGVPGDRAGDPG